MNEIFSGSDDMNEIDVQKEGRRGGNFWKIAGLMLLTVMLSVGAAVGVVYYTLFPGDFDPVRLNQSEQQLLDQKLRRVEGLQSPGRRTTRGGESVEPERYNDAVMSREISFTEREINALIATNTDLASKLAIDFSDDLASAKALIPLDPDMPFLGGKTLKISTGLEMRMGEGRPVIILRGISVWGVSLPNAWLGNMKGIDLASEYGGGHGFWRAFADGVEEIEVREGQLRLRLKE
ncbi:MAG: hypothetical protein OEZ16_12855 [Chromatiales bacterium]|nr:hypothetical protein [Chromatiales bacterium]